MEKRTVTDGNVSHRKMHKGEKDFPPMTLPELEGPWKETHSGFLGRGRTEENEVWDFGC